MSAALLLEPGKVHVLEDDIEAITHVSTWVCLRFACLGCPVEHLREYLRYCDQAHCNAEDQFVGGTGRRDMLRAMRVMWSDSTVDPSKPLITRPWMILSVV
ncbi:hypothetical protein AcW1_000273 [Taiwanofungus camphoratus]|nr:hypothetical protein AcW2_001230 [Antrodia cinnamomea]KAI0935875.1 hypothetical protein AcV5_004174 [Antrodia cinnamomea]KAI0961101.1 hypothetical protein AcV7_000294 [Antrodia cinnamomea]KAI0963092.1 hypothetical protein AcW1_000273 [Antrodia cinnamomea]